MSTFKVPVEVVTIEPHPNADALEIASIQGFQAIVKKGQFESGQHGLVHRSKTGGDEQ